jgi:hypothetical protein
MVVYMTSKGVDGRCGRAFWAILFANAILAASACFVTTPDNANVIADMAKIKTSSAEACWASCSTTESCVGADFRQKTRDCWLKSELSVTPVRVPGIVTLTPCVDVVACSKAAPAKVGLLAARDRVAISADGNYSDEDDIGATPMSLALLVQAGVKLVYYGYRSHVWEPETPRARVLYKGRSQDVRMSAAVMESIGVFGLDSALFVDEKARFLTGTAAQPELVAAINASTRDSRLWIIVAGPMLTVFRSMQEADRTALAHVSLVSHSKSNNIHAEQHRVGARWEDVKGIVIENGGSVHFGGITCSGCIRPTVNKPRDQNRLLNFRSAKDPIKAWTWLRDSSDERLNFVFRKIVDSNVADVSDAGMVYTF